MKGNRFYPPILWLVGFAITAKYALSFNLFNTDTEREYLLYQGIIERGYWLNVSDSLQSSCLTTTLIPALIQRATGLDPLMLFKIFPCIIMAFLPVLVYFVSKQYLKGHYAFLAGVFIIAQICFLWSLAYARSNVAVTFVALLILVMLKDNWSLKVKIPLLLISAVGITISHYNTAYITLAILGATCLCSWALKVKIKMPTRQVLTITLALVFLLSSSLLWNGIIAKAPQAYGGRAVGRVIDEAGEAVGLSPANSPPSAKSPPPGFYSLKRRDPVIAVAFGKTLPYMNNAQRTEFGVSWLTILLMTFGLIYSIIRFRKQIGYPYIILATMSYLALLGAVIIPTISSNIGIARIYLNVIIVLSPFFVIGSWELFKRLKVKPYLPTLAILLLYGLCTSGIAHFLIGHTRVP